MLKPSSYYILPVKKCQYLLWSLQTTSNTAADAETEVRGDGNEENETQQVISEKHTNMTAGADDTQWRYIPASLDFHDALQALKNK